MKNRILIVFLVIAVLVGGWWILTNQKIILDKKHYCETDSDCVLSGRDPNGFATCVNKKWNEEWNKNPKSKDYVWECLYTGKEKCECINSKCQRTDSETSC